VPRERAPRRPRAILEPFLSVRYSTNRRVGGSNTPHSVLGVIRLGITPGPPKTDCLPFAIAPTSVCLRGDVSANRPGVLLPAFTHHLAIADPRLVSSLLHLTSRPAFAGRGPPYCFDGLDYSADLRRSERCGEVPLASKCQRHLDPADSPVRRRTVYSTRRIWREQGSTRTLLVC